MKLEEIEQLNSKLGMVGQQSSTAKFARMETKLEVSKATIASFKSQVEEISRERDDWKFKVQQCQRAKSNRTKEFKKLIAQVRNKIINHTYYSSFCYSSSIQQTILWS